MTLTERAAAAAELKTTGQCNCAQSVVKVFEDKLPVESDTLRRTDRRCDGGRYPDGGPRHARCGTRTGPEL